MKKLETMKKWKIKKTGLAAVLAVVAASCLITGCKAKSAVQDEALKKEQTEVAYDPSKASWEQDQNPVELNWFVGYDWAAMNFDPEHNVFDKYVYDHTGVRIKFSAGNQEKLSMLIATGNLPDIVTYDAVSTERLTMENGGRLLPLDTLKESYAPDLKAPQAMIDWYRNENDRHWYAWVSYFYDLKDTYERGGYIESHNMNFARKDMMDQLGINPDSMNTKEGFIDALNKVKESGIKYNGQTVIPFIGDDVEYLAEQFGTDKEDKDGNMLNIQRQPEYLEALLFLNEIYHDGLTTDEIFTMDKNMRKQLIASGQVFAGTNHVYLEGKEDLFYSDPNALMEGVGLIKGSGGKEAIVSPSPTAGWTATMITKNCKNPARAAALLSFLTKEETSLSYYFGGIDGYDIKDGAAVIKPEREEERSKDPSAFDAKYRSELQSFLCDYVWVAKAKPKDHLDALQADLQNYQKKWIDGHIYDNKIFTDVNPDGGTDLAAVAAQLSSYWAQQFPSIVMAPTKEEAKALYQNAIDQMDTMGMAELDQYKNEKFQKNKKKMGVTFAWPRNQGY